ncbi:hypothetical protein [Fusobacterium sp. PH5-44]|uniref:hypothetical protein n=1 Tax=unclassified Fusobacterium TaxID=2648384 RepID=UPI003D1ADDA3
MIDLRIYDTARDGNYEEFMKIYNKDSSSIYCTYMDTVLISALYGGEPYDERFEIVKFLIEKK